ncbi:hypothetical protein VFPBJ_03931 [Purpureocillium lilacinum]|uniref:Uncharacterized protein n=1 Tax=Purpureocillium lilacinum TaxID=33203 RepID=A0A179GTS5_PURLI|nr:hypothetical protein VFPBJ_03931 [Purpureocillium lilacinum]
MSDPRVQVLAKQPEVTGNVGLYGPKRQLHRAYALRCAHRRNSGSTSQSASLVVPTRSICHQVQPVQPYRLPSCAARAAFTGLHGNPYVHH